MKSTTWILLDTETTGFAPPIYVVELAAQRMLGWKMQASPFRKLLNQNRDVPPEASRVHGYTREILERDGEPALQVYRDFGAYAANLPIVSFNLPFDLDDVLVPEWKRLGIPPIGSKGFCALRLAQRLLDPVPAGNCKLQTLRQYYRLPERGAHTALGDVQTVADLFDQVLRPIAEQRGLNKWEELVRYSSDEWYPSRIVFGKHKGRLFWEARTDQKLRGWLEWLAASSNARSRNMGRWYLRQLEIESEPLPDSPVSAVAVDGASKQAERSHATPRDALVIYVNPHMEQLRRLVAAARARLAELEADYTRERSRVDAMHAALFRQLREHYQRRDRFRLIVDYRRRYLDALLRSGEDDAKQSAQGYEEARARVEREYEETSAAVAKKHPLTAEEEMELTRLWKKLVKLYHPDRFAGEPDKLDTYTKLTGAINRAKDTGDMKTLREIAEDPAGYILRQGWASLDFSDEVLVAKLRRLYDTLQIEIITVIESLGELRNSPDYELSQLCARRPAMLDELAKQQAKALEEECRHLEGQACKLAEEIQQLSGDGSPPIA